MTKIIIGTTPTITYTFKVVSVSDITKAVLTIKDRGTIIIEKTISDAVVGEDTLSWTLTQQETLLIGVKTCAMMLNWKLQDGTRGASAEVSIEGANNSKWWIIGAGVYRAKRNTFFDGVYRATTNLINKAAPAIPTT